MGKPVGLSFRRTMKVLALDPAASTGYCIIHIEDDTASIVEYGFLEVENHELNGDRCLDLMYKIECLCLAESIDRVCIEDYFFSKRFANGCDVNAAFRTAIHIKLCELKIPYDILNISLWKKFISGRSTPTPLQKKHWGKEPAKKLMIQDSLWTKYKIRFPNHSLSLKTGKPIKFRSDVVDAVGQGIYFCKIILNVTNIRCDIVPPDDVEFKNKPKAMYEYKE